MVKIKTYTHLPHYCIQLKIKNTTQILLFIVLATIFQKLKNAYIFTIFGYSAQKSDIDAVNLLKQNWNEKELEQFEIIVK